MNADGREAGTDLPRRSVQYLRTIEMLAQRGAVSGGAGPWLDIARRAAQAQERLVSGAGCDVALHAQYLELALWGRMLVEYVLPEWHDDLAAAIHRVAREETRDLAEESSLSVRLVCPELHPSGPAPERPSASFEELVLIRQLQQAARRGTATALEEALRSLALSSIPAGDSEHARCGAWDLLMMRDVVIRALAETIPRPYRTVLAVLAQHAFYRLYAPDEDTPQFLHQVPRHMEKGEDIWTFNAIWSAVVHGWTKDPTPDRGSGPWLIEELAVIAHGWEDEKAERARRTMDQLNRRIHGD